MIVKRKRHSKVIGGTIVRRRGTVGQWRDRPGDLRIGGGVHDGGGHDRHGGYEGGFGKKWIFLCLGLLLVGALAGGAAWLWQSPYFEISEVQVGGNERVPMEVIAERAGVMGQSMFSADLAAAQRALDAHPLIKSAVIERRWPHTVTIVVEERQGWGTWEQAGVGYTIDREGVVLASTPMPPGAPTIRSSQTTTRRMGDRVDYQAVDSAAEIYEKLPRILGTQVKEVAFLTGQGVQVTTADGQVALLGDSSSIAYKLAVWAQISKEARVQHVNYSTIDLRFGNRPVVR